MIEKKIKKNYLFFLLFGLMIFTLFLNNSFNYLDPDLGWHLKAGEDIYLNKEVSAVNHYNYTLQDKDWINHEWLLDLASFLIFDNLGYISLSIIFALLSTLIIILLFHLAKIVNDKNKYLKNFYLIFATLGYFLLAPSFGVRMQVIGYLSLVLLLIIIAKYDKNQKYNILLFLVPLFLIWANTHASFLFGLAVLFLYLSIKIIGRFNFIKKFKFINTGKKLSKKKLSLLLALTLSSLAITLINPYGLELYSFLQGYGNTFYLSYISEWLPIHYLPINYYTIFYIGVFLALIIINFKQLKKTSFINIFWWILSFLTFFMAIKSKRNSTLLLLSSLPVMIALAQTTFSKEELNILKNKVNYYINNKAFKVLFIIIYLLLLFKIAMNISFTKDPFQSYCDKYPCQALNFIQEREDLRELKILNNYGWGGYLIWTWPEKQLFIDGRMPQLNYENHTILEEYVEFFSEDNFEKQLNKYQIELILMNKAKEFKKESSKWYKIDKKLNNNSKNNLISFLEESVDWEQVFIDGVSTIYVKKTSP